MKQEYTSKLRMTPTKKQEVLLSKHFGCIRFVYNVILDRDLNVSSNILKQGLSNSMVGVDKLAACLDVLAG